MKFIMKTTCEDKKFPRIQMYQYRCIKREVHRGRLCACYLWSKSEQAKTCQWCGSALPVLTAMSPSEQHVTIKLFCKPR